MTSKFGGTGARTRSNISQEYVPSSSWSRDAVAHYLNLELPGFKQDQVKFEVDKTLTYITVYVDKILENKYIFVEQNYDLPQNVDVDNISGKFEGETFILTFPKRIKEYQSDRNDAGANLARRGSKDGEYVPNSVVGGIQGNRKGNDRSNSQRYGIPGVQGEIARKSLLGVVMEMVKKNKGVALIVVLAFLMGISMTLKTESTFKELKERVYQCLP